MNKGSDVVPPVRVGESSQNKVSVGIRVGIILDWEESDLSSSTIRLSTREYSGPIFSFLKNTLNILKANQKDRQ